MNALRPWLSAVLLVLALGNAPAQTGSGTNLPEPPAQPPSSGWEDDRSIPGVQPGSGVCAQACQRLEHYLAERPVYHLVTVWNQIDAGQMAPLNLAGVTYSDFREGLDLGLAGSLQRRSGASLMVRYSNLSDARREMVQSIVKFNSEVRRRGGDREGPISAEALGRLAGEAGQSYASWVGKPHYALVAAAGRTDGVGEYVQGGVAASWLRPLGPSGTKLSSVSSGVDFSVTALYVQADTSTGQSISGLNPSFSVTWWDKVARWCEDNVNDQPVGFVSRWNTQVGVRVGVRNRFNAQTPWRAFVRVRCQPDQRKGLTPREFMRDTIDVTLSAGRDSLRRDVIGVGFAIAR